VDWQVDAVEMYTCVNQSTWIDGGYVWRGLASETSRVDRRFNLLSRAKCMIFHTKCRARRLKMAEMY